MLVSGDTIPDKNGNVDPTQDIYDEEKLLSATMDNWKKLSKKYMD